ncbi:CoA ester lyase [Pseudoroseomonas wenyumeiae]|uniref:CoA ester lyase n=1 Tax=Teichococcus wenyumeiae TaxID=2478470 RepID=A0A3A9JFL7_9PROT|nr:CoA ester lyase [Pseudoroseomonas wenyumeiae]RKK04131.1 CoA ester lyase [Pseudoroseomonas wenyumeiae]RMI17149.1 CoA ester lyase [Pseudoroseomonas wenyumeiae]
MSGSAAPRWRSLLFVPANVERFIARANERGADGVILDLEDAVPAQKKPEGRAMLRDSITSITCNGTAAMVRVNHNLRYIGQDLEAAVMPGLTALVLPKVEDAGFVRDVADTVAELEREQGLPLGEIKFILQVETPRALFALPAIAGAHPRVAAMTLGPEDYSAAMGGVPEPDALLTPNYAVLCAARAAGILPLGFVGSIGAYSDIPAFAEMARRARRLGFRGAMIVHPSQVEPLNQAFTPTPEELDWAHRVVTADAAARAEGRGAFPIDGKMVDAPVVRRAEEILALAG